ncbi:3-oxoadipate enol-lactonase [Gandjariella thermophila]|uniref:3-oxoadipate enol-lactonase n=1 Tax=Gandjariella thermophila TaxID=1931992 RepID=A0A4D4JC99_9PSEU|nr:3-oxoadipate enol-lactonase [Gandjariella thermophila]GDY31537.1 3-oxoadipate enol-lactonase [Gandjariella thermophila]
MRGARLGYDVTGDEHADVVVMAGSIGTTREMWRPQLPVLAERFRVVRVDHRGHGESWVPPGPYTIADLAGDVLDLLDALGVAQVRFCGLSLGGMVGMWLAAHAPDRIRRLAVLCTSAALNVNGSWENRAATVRAQGMSAMLGAAPGRWFTEDFRRDHPNVVDDILAMLAGTPAEGYAGCCDAIAVMDLRADLARITVPTLAIAGADDPATPPAHLEEIARRVPGARLETIPRAAHLANVEHPETVNRLLLAHFTEE